MLDCWREHPDRRPSFDELDENISQMVEEEVRCWCLHGPRRGRG